MTTLDANIVALKEQADELVNFGDAKEISRGNGMLFVLNELEKFVPKEPKPNERYPDLRKVELTIIAHNDEAQIIARNMEDSFIAQEGLYTLSCGNIETINNDELELFIDEIPEDLLEY